MQPASAEGLSQAVEQTKDRLLTALKCAAVLAAVVLAFSFLKKR